MTLVELWFSQGICPVAGLLGHIIVLFLVGLRTFTPVGGLLWYKCSPVCESPSQQLWDFILLLLCPSYRLTAASPLSLDVGYVFGEFQCLPVDDCSAVSGDSGALARGSERTSFSSANLNQSLRPLYFFFLRVIP